MITLTPEIIAGVYDALRLCQPFKRWKLPPSEEVQFDVIGFHDREAHYTRYVRTSEHIVGVSHKKVGHFDTLCIAVGHEMIHLKQAIYKQETSGEHNAAFKRDANIVCRNMGWDEKSFS